MSIFIPTVVAFTLGGDCRTGIDRSDLDQCLGEITNQDCSGPLDSLERNVQCNMDDLCRD
jgi:hypothetical protein